MYDYDYTFKLLLLGDASVGKTSFTKQYCYNVFNPSERLTIGVDFHVKTVEVEYNGVTKLIKLQIWDLGGEERFRFLLPTYCLGANGAFLLYDITRPSTLENITEWTTIVRKKGGDIPILLVEAKIDLDELRKIPQEHGKQIVEKNKLAGFIEISSKQDVNVDKAFELLTKLTLEKMEESK
jgi:small GTP-binding protein